MTPAAGPARPDPGHGLSAMLGIAVTVLAADTISTTLALDELARNPTVRLLNGLITMHLTLNAGAAFGYGAAYTAVIGLLGCGIIISIVAVASRLRSRAWTIALGLLLGGAAGNLGDRVFRAPGMFRGRVVDWINLPHFPWTFNPADASITCAAALIAVLAVRGVRIDGTSARASAGRPSPVAGRPSPLAADRPPALALDPSVPLAERDALPGGRQRPDSQPSRDPQ
ncbi:MAG: signal peptidase II [Actinomycetota bacterium]|nr:signal peptidase II [Actinomycetota bacterium]